MLKLEERCSEGQRIAVVLPAYNAAATLERTYVEIPKGLVDEVLLVDDASQDDTVSVSHRLGVRTFVHEANLGLRRKPEDLLSGGS